MLLIIHAHMFRNVLYKNSETLKYFFLQLLKLEIIYHSETFTGGFSQPLIGWSKQHCDLK